MSFTCEEVWQYLPKVAGARGERAPGAVPGAAEILGERGDSRNRIRSQTQDWTTLRRGARRGAEGAGRGAQQQADRHGSRGASYDHRGRSGVFGACSAIASQLRYLFIVSAVTLAQGSGNGTGGVHIEVKKAEGAKCDRCWNYSTHVGEDKTYPTVCERCSAVLKELEQARTR